MGVLQHSFLLGNSVILHEDFAPMMDYETTWKEAPDIPATSA